MAITMHIEKPTGTITQHGFHLGTDLKVAEGIVEERLRADREIVTIALRQDGKVLGVYDFRCLKPTMLEWAHKHQRELVSLLGNIFTQDECRAAKLRLPKRPENVPLWGILNDAMLGDFIDWPK